jgi:hypothetical protein
MKDLVNMNLIKKPRSMSAIGELKETSDFEREWV